MSDTTVVGVIGGSGLYEIQGLESVESIELSTPFGSPSDAFVTGVLGGVRMAFLPRHGRGHRILPTEINFRANIWGMKKLGVSRILSISAVGSMREDIAPGTSWSSTSSSIARATDTTRSSAGAWWPT